MTEDKTVLAERLAQLREALKGVGATGFIVPHEDEYQNEFLPPHAERLAFLTGFTGSAGAAVVLEERAAVFVDGRYVLQVAGQVDTALWDTHNIADLRPEDWTARHVAAGDVIAYDPWLHTPVFRERWARALEAAGARLEPLIDNPLDALWTDRPQPAGGRAVPHPLSFAGRESADKRRELGAGIAAAGGVAALITALDSVAWLFNIRGSDVPFTPLVEARALLKTDGTAALYIAGSKLSEELVAHLGGEVAIRPSDALAFDLADLAKDGPVMADPRVTPLALFQVIEAAGGQVIRADDPCALPKAIKNGAELEGMRQAHIRDGAALTRFLAWLDAQSANSVDELAAAAALYERRASEEHFQGASFETISGAGPNGAVIHYRAEPASNRVLAAGELFLVDSGGQYLDGTTDVTRTIPIGQPDAEQIACFTRVLKGHIAIARARFPRGTTGAQLDSLARQPLWEAGLDYDHGTGHGVGSYLGVHEGPQGISRRAADVALSPGMILSNEPGFYKANAFGIRIESLVAVRAEPVADGGRPFLSFETLTLAPIDRRLVDIDLLTEAERQWLDDYHARVRETLSPRLDAATRQWLAEATAPLPVREAAA